MVGGDERHYASEERLYALGHTDRGRRLFAVFTIREGLIRVISARDMSRKESKDISVVMKKKVPNFKDEEAEREFWANHDSTEFIDWRKAKRQVLPNLKPSSQTTSLRLPNSMLDRLKLLANKRDVPYQSLLKMFLAERLNTEFEKIE